MHLHDEEGNVPQGGYHPDVFKIELSRDISTAHLRLEKGIEFNKLIQIVKEAVRPKDVEALGMEWRDASWIVEEERSIPLEESRDLILKLARNQVDCHLVVDVGDPREKTAREALRDSGNGHTGCPDCMEDCDTEESLKTAPDVARYVWDAGHHSVGVKLTPGITQQLIKEIPRKLFEFPDEVDFDFVAFVQHDFKSSVAQRYENQEILDGSKRLGIGRLWGEIEIKKDEAGRGIWEAILGNTWSRCPLGARQQLDPDSSCKDNG